MTYAQSRWLYDILQEHGFEVCVRAFEQNIETLGYDNELNRQKQLCLQKLEITTIGRSEYIQTEIGKYEQCLRDCMNQINDIRFCDVYNIMKITWNYVLSKTIIDELRKQVEEKEPKSIPNELYHDNTKMILQKAIDAGLCDDNYKWGKTNRLLAYFVDKACEYLEISIGQYDGREKVKWKPFEKLFGIDNLAQAKKDYQREGQIPKGSEIVDRIFNSN